MLDDSEELRKRLVNLIGERFKDAGPDEKKLSGEDCGT